MAQVGSSASQAADENELRSLLGLGSQSPRHNKPSPGPYQKPQQQSSSYATYSPASQQASLAQSQRPQQYQPVIEPLAPRPQKLAQFDSLGYENLIPPPTFTQQSSQHSQGIHQQMQPQHLPPPPHFIQHHHQSQQQQQPHQRQSTLPTASQQHFVSAPLMPSVLLNKNQTSQASPPTQPRTAVASQPQTSSSYSGQQYGPSHQAPQYSPTSSGFQKYGPPPVLRVKSPLSQSHTYGYASSDYSSSDPRVGAQSIPPPPVPPVESRPAHTQQQPQQQQQQQAPRRASGDRVQQALSPRGSPQSRGDQALSVNKAMDVLSEALQKIPLSQSQGAVSAGGSYNHVTPVSRQLFRDYLSTCLQVSTLLRPTGILKCDLTVSI